MNLQTALTIGRMAERVEQIFQTQQYILQELKRMSTAVNALDAQIANLTADVDRECGRSGSGSGSDSSGTGGIDGARDVDHQ